MIECEEAGGWTEIGKSAVDRAVSVGRLIGIGEVGLADTPELGERTVSSLPESAPIDR